MKIVIRELREGSNPLRFTIPAADLAAIVNDLDELYSAERDGEVDLDLQKYSELMHLTGTVHAPIRFSCARCLAERTRELNIPIHWTLLPKSGQADETEEIELNEDDLDTSFYEGEEIDLGELAREAILLELEPIPRCAPDENCDTSGFVTEAVDGTTEETKEDPRWAPLKKLLAGKDTN